MRQQLNKNNSKDKQNSKESQNLDKRKKYYNPQLVNRPTFVAASQKVVYFGKNSNIFLDSSGVIGQLQRQASIFPDRIKNQIQCIQSCIYMLLTFSKKKKIGFNFILNNLQLAFKKN
eukprot:TRINITY_DN8630_c0_g1_i10.p2 TRINITY_DN8630_c0_g1~~TRINITY_DN8630_c0_g1_i10.p2  ORF type:complete len:117 (+),score=22.83 TRINITY_DN8630_c0_g1_i10:132-482(+)